jgi:acetyl-CoA decarbonylase/synthase complex subunit gamma
MERSGVPINLLIPDAGGYSVLTAWAAGKAQRFLDCKNSFRNTKSKTKSNPEDSSFREK